MNSLKEIAAELRKPGETLLTTHILPDGDSIGSLLGLGLSMREAGFAVTMHSADGVPFRYRFLRGTEHLVAGEVPDVAFARVVTLDCSDPLRLRPVWAAVKDRLIINIDHHTTNQRFGTLNFVDPAAAATGEIIFDLLSEMGLPLKAEVAAALYVAISTDTGSFKYENTTPRTYRLAAQLVEAGAKPQELSLPVFDLRTRAATFILRLALESLKFSADGRIAWMVLTEEEMERAGAKDEDLEGIVNFAKNIENVEIGLIFRAQKEGSVKVAFRSRNIDVSKVAEVFGGGGHPRASGCSLESDLDSAVTLILSALQNILPRTKD